MTSALCITRRSSLLDNISCTCNTNKAEGLAQQLISLDKPLLFDPGPHDLATCKVKNGAGENQSCLQFSLPP